MRRASVYIETSVVSDATSRPNRDLVIAARQQITRDWFAARSKSYALFASQLVVAEASGGDEEAAGDRVALLRGIPRLAITDAAGAPAAELMKSQRSPRRLQEMLFTSPLLPSMG